MEYSLTITEPGQRPYSVCRMSTSTLAILDAARWASHSPPGTKIVVMRHVPSRPAGETSKAWKTFVKDANGDTWEVGQQLLYPMG